MKKVLIIALIAGLAVAWGIRFYFVNQNIDIPTVQVFRKGIEVPLEKDFFDSSDEDMNGYTVTVLDAELMPVEDFLQRYEAEDQTEILGNFTDYIYMVRVSVGNHNNPFIDEKGVALQLFELKGVDYILTLEDICYQASNPDMPGASFSLRQGTNMELLLPFNVMSSQTGIKHILNKPPKLQISAYPNQKLIELY
ncbi:MAG: DUF5028 domain-containing protein [Oscillospiraceae bacterium]|nr:DUF5028 domain-containing protein [Oscillospiraceae bacterium]